MDIDFEDSSCDYTLSLVWRAGNATANLQFVLRLDNPSDANAIATGRLTDEEEKALPDGIVTEGLRGFSVHLEKNHDLIIRCPEGTLMTDVRASSQ